MAGIGVGSGTGSSTICRSSATTSSADNYILPSIVNQLVGTRMQVATGYIGQNEINLAVERTGKKASAKGMVVTGADIAKNEKLFRLYSLVYPVVWAITRLDALVPASGYMLIASARRQGPA